jgi:hypothetical protein
MLAGMFARHAPSGGGGTDPYFASVVSLLNFSGADGSTTFTDAKGVVWTPHGDAQIQGGQLTLDGSGDWLQAPASSSWDFGSGDFTVEAILTITGNSPLNNDAIREGSIISCYPTGGGDDNTWFLNVLGTSLTTGTGSYFSKKYGGARQSAVSGAAVPGGSDVHYAASKVGNTVRHFIAGVKVAEAVLSDTNVAGLWPLKIGALGYTGYEDYINATFRATRITKGVGRYSANFSPPVAPFPTA